MKDKDTILGRIALQERKIKEIEKENTTLTQEHPLSDTTRIKIIQNHSMLAAYFASIDSLKWVLDIYTD